MASEKILQDKPKLSRRLMSFIGMLVIIGCIIIVGINKKSRDSIRADIIQREETHQVLHIDSVVATFNEAKESLQKTSRTPAEVQKLYESMLTDNVKYLNFGEQGKVMLIDKNSDILFTNTAPSLAPRTLNLIALQGNQANSNYTGLKGCIDIMKNNVENGRCLDTTTNDTVHYFWHRIPSLGINVNGNSYTVIVGFRESEILDSFNKVEKITAISLFIQSTLLVFAMFVSLWAISMNDYYHKVIKQQQ